MSEISDSRDKSGELKHARREEIVNACAKLYATKSFREITIKDISAVISFSRPSIYNYFETKEEIFLALLQREYEIWAIEINDMTNSHDFMTVSEFAEGLAHSLEKRLTLLKLLSMNMYDMEQNSRVERLTEFKVSYGASRDALSDGLNKFFPEMSEDEIECFIYFFLPFMFGMYPYTFVTEKQAEAMTKAGVSFKHQTIYDVAYGVICKLLQDDQKIEGKR